MRVSGVRHYEGPVEGSEEVDTRSPLPYSVQRRLEGLKRWASHSLGLDDFREDLQVSGTLL